MKISIANDFSEAPWGRFPSDGDFCGQFFRDRLLVPALKSNEQVTVDLDGVEGLGSSFLDEAFAGLVLKHGFTPEQLHKRLEVVTTHRPFQMYVTLIWQYIDKAGHPTKRLAA